MRNNLTNHLPKKFVKKHQLLLYYNDLIVDILKKADELNLTYEEIHSDEKISIKDDEDIIDWLMNNNYEKKAYRITGSHVFFSLLRDFIFYIHESFSCSERGKVSVAFAVSRKPIKDTLFHLCWLLVRPKQYLDKLLFEKPESYDITNGKLEQNEPGYKKKIYEEAINKISDKNMKFDATLLHDLIYNKGSDISLTSAWDLSLHLVTGNPNYKTISGNLNFVFADTDIWDNFWNTYYAKIPYIMSFMIEVSITIFETILIPNEASIFFNKQIRRLKLIQASDDTKAESDFYKYFFEILDDFHFECSNCSKEIFKNTQLKKEFLNDFLYKCSYCDSIERTGQYFIVNK